MRNVNLIVFTLFSGCLLAAPFALGQGGDPAVIVGLSGLVTRYRRGFAVSANCS